MEFIRTLRKKSQTKKEEYASKLSENVITLSDFDSTLYIAYEGVPLIPIEDSWTTKQIVEELKKIRTNFINVKLNKQSI